LASISGFIVFLTSLGCIVWALYTKMRGMTVPGWTSIVIPMFFIGGLNMLFLGIVGEYLGKIYLEVKRRPLFIVAEKLNFDD
jgi:polyisoprenyl-phosphate glycosyltransferase